MLNITRLISLPLILYFLPAFVFFLGEKSFFPYLIILVPIALFLICYIEKNRLVRYFSFLYKHTPFKYFIYFYIWAIISGVVALICGYYSFSRFFSFVFIGFILRALLIYIYPQVVIPRYVSLKSLIKIFAAAYVLIFLWGILEFIGAYFHISVINDIVAFISNIRGSQYSVIIDQHSNFPRVRSVCMEPGTFGLFIAVNLPIIYRLCLSKYKIFDNIYFNFFVKKVLIAFSWLCVILTQSPIYLIICLFVSIIFFYKKIFAFVKKYYRFFIIILSIATIAIVMFSTKYDLQKSYISRIINFISVLGTFDIFEIIFTDQSLGTRIVNNINQFVLFLKHPIFGIGFGNNGNLLIQQFLNSPVSLTPEMELHLQRGDASLIVTTNAMYYLLHKTGIVGFALYCLFMVKCIIYSAKAKIYFDGIEKVFVSALNKSLITIFSISILYNQNFMDQYLFFLTALVSSIIVIAYLKNKEKFSKNTVEENEK